MHPNRAFDWQDRDEILAFVADIAFAHLFVPTPDGPMVVHVPLVVTADGRIRFHVAKANRACAHLDGAVALASLAGPDAYISPDWYGADDHLQVPTWNYVTVEASGPVRRLPGEDLVGILDTLSANHEARLHPKAPWTRGKMRPGLFEGLLRSIVGFEMAVEALRGTRKLGQNKKPAERQGAIEGLRGADRAGLAALMAETLPPEGAE